MKIVIPGGSGHVGSVLARAFVAEQHDVVVLSRSPRAATAINPARTIAWDGRTVRPDWSREIDGADVVINLAGRTVDCRYGPRERAEILDSRVDSTRAIGEAIRAAARPPRVWLNASTATLYRHALDRPMDEATGELGGNEPGAPEKWNFSVEVGKRWEATFFGAQVPATVRRVALRSAMTMSPDRGSVFDVLSRLVRFGLGGSVGSGRQYVSWLHHVDFVRAVQFLIEREELDGPVNLASPNPLPYRDFMAELRRAWGVPIGLPATEWMLEIGTFVLRTESELVLKSRRVVPGRMLGAGFSFTYPEWPAAAADLCRGLRGR